MEVHFLERMEEVVGGLMSKWFFGANGTRIYTLQESRSEKVLETQATTFTPEHSPYGDTFLEDDLDEEQQEGDDLDYTPVTISHDSSSYSCQDDSLLTDQSIPQTVVNHNFNSPGYVT